MAKKDKVIKRVYKKGKEITILSAKRPRRRRKLAAKIIRKKKINMPIRDVKMSMLTTATKPVFIDSYELPACYGTTYLTLMVKDPFWVYAYWEIAPESVSASALDSAKVVLRMYDVSLKEFNGYNANSFFDIEVGLANSWYINLWFDNVSYVGEIGLRTPNGRFSALARSNCVHTPRVNYSPRSEQIWMKVDGEKPISTYIIPVEIKQRASVKRKVIYVSEGEIRSYYNQLSPLLRDIISSRLGRLYGRRWRKYRFLLEGESEEEKNAFLSRLPKGYFIKRRFFGSSEEFILLGVNESAGASEFAYLKG